MKKIFLFAVILCLSSCSKSIGSYKLHHDKVSSVEKELMGKSKDDVFAMYNDGLDENCGFVGNFVVNGKEISEFKYAKVTFNQARVLPLIGLIAGEDFFYNNRYLYVHFDEGKVVKVEMIKRSGWVKY
jgi:hypothetical protein